MTEFFAPNGKRPVRLCEKTRRFAIESQNYKYGKETWENKGVPLDDIKNFESLSPLEKYDLAIERITKYAPLRICDGEKISGAATLGPAINHAVPATFQKKPVFSSVSHLTLDFETVLKEGIDGIQKRAEEALEKYKSTEKETFIKSALHCINCMKIWRDRYLQELEKIPNLKANLENLKRVPFRPAENFHEAVQSLWFTFAFVRLCGNWTGIGRIDYLLGDFLEKDLKNGTLTVEEAREILAHFFIKGCEWIKGGNYGSGDAQHYQNILLGGCDESGKEITCTVSYLVLDILEELGISDFPTSVRIHKNTDPKFLNRISEVIRLGGGVIAVYNEDLVIQSLIDNGYKREEARKFANDGCWEIQIPGKTFFTYIPFDALQILQQKTLDSYSGKTSFSNFDSLYRAFIRDLKKTVEELIDIRNKRRFFNTDLPVEKWVFTPSLPCTVVSLFEKGCIEKGLSYLEGGPLYNLYSPHIGGLPDVANSLFAIKKLVFDEKKISFADLMLTLRENWQGNEALRRYALGKITYFGNDNDEVDRIAKNIVEDFADICDSLKSAYQTPAGISTFGRQLEWSRNRLATPCGKRKNSVLSNNFSPSPGTDKEGATGIIKSYCKANLKRMVSGAALDIKLLPSAVNGENGVEVISSLLRGFVLLGGHFMQPDIADPSLLKRAQEAPEEYQTLSVRVSGWNARFVTLNKEWQDMIINQMGSDT
ncbi:MAG: hypothetical protein IKU24_04195 [Clostridia bacterium]|nr:hypothetical protein [Clostridia bacterium]